MANAELIFVPGFGASELSAAVRGKPVKKIWYDLKTILALTPKCLQLAPDGISPKITPPGALITTNFDTFGVYTSLISFLQNSAMNVSTYPWDWRKDLALQAQQLATGIFQRFPSGPFYVLTHSTGGILAQLAYPTWKALGSAATWVSTTYLACPHGGTYWGPAGLNLIPLPGNPYYAFLNAALQVAIGYAAAGITTKNITALLQQAAASWPSLSALGPNTAGSWGAVDTNAPQSYVATNYAIGNPSVIQSQLDNAKAVQAQLVAYYSTPRPKETSYVGTGYATLTSMNPNAFLFSTAAYNQTNEGDGTVPANRAILPNGISIVGNWTHLGMVNDAFLRSRIVQDILNPPTEGDIGPQNQQRPVLSTIVGNTIRNNVPNGINTHPGVNDITKIDP